MPSWHNSRNIQPYVYQNFPQSHPNGYQIIDSNGIQNQNSGRIAYDQHVTNSQGAFVNSRLNPGTSSFICNTSIPPSIVNQYHNQALQNNSNNTNAKNLN